MLCLDASALIDYLHGRSHIGMFLEEHSSDILFAPTIALHEVFVGAVRTRGVDGLAQAQTDLDWVEAIPLSLEGAVEAAHVSDELLATGESIGPLDALIAGTIRSVGGTIVTRDAGFERVDGLRVVRYGSV